MRSDIVQLGTGFARAVGGALLFSMPLLMTMELWQIGTSVGRWRLVALVAATLVLTLGLARTFGAARGSPSWRDAVVDAGVAVLAGTVAAVVVLGLLEVVNPVASWGAAASVVTIEALPASIGAAFARSQLGQGSGGSGGTGYGHELFLMAAGAVVFASNVAPTEEIVLLAAALDETNALLLMLLSLALTHALVYGSGFAGQEQARSSREALVGFTLPGYAIALAVSAFMLWTFGRYDDTGLLVAVVEAVVLALPASLGAAAARLIL